MAREEAQRTACGKKAFETYRIGCAFAPSYDNGKVTALQNLIEEMIEEHKTNNWK